MKISNKYYRAFLILAFVLKISTLPAQQTFKYSAALPKPDTAGFYQITLAPAILAKCKSDLSDLRLTGKDNKFIPYIFGNQFPTGDQKGSFFILPQLKSAVESDTTTVFLVENIYGMPINHLYLELRNTDVKRTVDLSGSDDQKRWFAIKENIELTEGGQSYTGKYRQVLNFPSSTYRYFKITINHKSKEPIAILSAGIYKQQFVKGASYTGIAGVHFFQKDSNKQSTVIINLNETYFVNKLHLDIISPKYYKRRVLLYADDRKAFKLINDTTLQSLTGTDLFFSAKTNTIKLEIFNGDSPAISIKGIAAYQLDQSLLAYLEKDQQYNLLFGDTNAIAPDYDLKFFADSLHHQLSLSIPGDIKNNVLYQSKKAVVKQAIPAWVLWVAILLVVGVLVLLTLKMTKEINKRPVT